MLTNDVTLVYNDEANAAATKTLKLVQYLPDGSKRLASDSSLTEPHNLLIRHTSSGSNGALVDRHSVTSTVTKLNSAGKAVTMQVNTSFTLPRDPVFSAEFCQEVYEMQASFLLSSDMLASGYRAGVTANPGALAEILRGGS